MAAVIQMHLTDHWHQSSRNQPANEHVKIQFSRVSKQLIDVKT